MGEERSIYFGEVTEMVHDFLKKTPDDLDCFRDQAYSVQELKQVLYDENDSYRLWNSNCPNCESFLLTVNEVHAFQFSNRFGVYHFLCGTCYRKMKLNQAL